MDENCIVYDELEQGSKEWFEARAGIPTASEASKIIGSKAAYATYLIGKEAEKHMDVFDPGFQGGAVQRGHELEPIAIERFCEQELKECKVVGFVRNNKMIAGWSPDALVVGEKAGVEVKCFAKDNHYKAKLQGPDSKVIAQCHFALTVSGLEKMYVVHFNPDFKPDYQVIVHEVTLSETMRKTYETLIKSVNISVKNVAEQV